MENNFNIIQQIKKEESQNFLKLIRNLSLYIFIFFFIVTLSTFIMFFLNNFIFINYEITFYMLWYPFSFLILLIWIKIFCKDSLKKYLLKKPRWPKKNQRLFYTAYFIFFIVCILSWFSFLIIGPEWAILREINFKLIILRYLHSCLYAPIVEEIMFRGYWHEQAINVWGEDGWYIEWKKKIFINNRKNGIKTNSLKDIIEQPIMNFQITYANIFSSLLFALWHLNIIKVLYTFFGGLIFVKTKREWGNTLVVPIILHSSWNFLAEIFYITEFPFISKILDFIKNLF